MHVLVIRRPFTYLVLYPGKMNLLFEDPGDIAPDPESEIRIVMFKNRREVFPTDEDLVRMCVKGLEKYTLDYTLRKIRELNPGLESEFSHALEKSKR